MRLLQQTALIALLALGIGTNVQAKDVNPDHTANKWRGYGNGDRSNYAMMASIMCQSRSCDGASIKACMDEATRPPAPPGLNTLTIGELAIKCIKIIKAQE
jgi:hypothetical protein